MRRIQDDIRRYRELGVLDTLNYDYTTEKPLLDDGGLAKIESYAERSNPDRKKRARSHAEIVTPLWVCNMMLDCFEGENPGCYAGRTTFLDICCGEGPFMYQPYDVETGEEVPVSERGGEFDRKMKAMEPGDGVVRLFHALQDVYGYDIQRDNVLIARINALKSFEDHHSHVYGERPDRLDLEIAASIVSRNIFWMDGLEKTVPGTDKSPMVFFWKTGERCEFKGIGTEDKDAKKEMPGLRQGIPLPTHQ